MDKRKNHGGARPGAGRKKGIGLSFTIKNHVDDFMTNLFKDEVIKNKAKKQYEQLSLMEGYIYIIRNLDNNLIKVGVTQRKNPKERFSLYATHDMNIELLFLDKVFDVFELENEIHLMLEDDRVKGDWFLISDKKIIESINFINKHKYNKFYNG